jgi:predicted flap endonuclease-1-like 5' DNA nuclease
MLRHRLLTTIAPAALAFTLAIGAPAPARASNYAVDEIPQAIPAADAARLKAAGVPNTFVLLEKGADAAGRKKLAKQTKIAETTLEGWVQMADLLRVRGIGPDVARLLSAAGVKTIAQLKTQAPAELSDAIMKANSKLKLSENPPSAEHLSAWIEQAKTLPIVLK